MPDVHATITAADGLRRAVIIRRPDGFFQTLYEQFDDSAVGAVGGLSDPFWRPDRGEEVNATAAEAESRARTALALPST